MELALKKKVQDDEPESFDYDVFPLSSMRDFEELNEQLKQFHIRKSLVT